MVLSEDDVKRYAIIITSSIAVTFFAQFIRTRFGLEEPPFDIFAIVGWIIVIFVLAFGVLSIFRGILE